MSTFDLLIKGGEVVDGTGEPRFRADLGIRDGRIIAVGDCDGSADSVIDADGLVVSPGIVDIHTHYDAQILWDPACTPSSLHGVTTVVSGNCGFTLAPMDESEADYVVRMLAHVEGMPIQALYAGVDFSWKTFGEYLSRLEGSVGVNIGFLAGHSTLRRLVMAERALGGEADETQIAAMSTRLRSCLAEGALGFSSSQSPTHYDAEGNPVPSRFASRSELIALARVVRDYPGTVLEFIPGVMPFTDEMFDLMADMSLTADRSLNWNSLLAVSDLEELVNQTLTSHERIGARGARVVPLTLPATMTIYLSLANGFPYGGLPGWATAMGSPLKERMSILADPTQRQRWAAGAQMEGAGILRKTLSAWGGQTVVSTFAPENRPYEGRTIGAIASELGQDPFNVMLDLALRDGLRTVFKAVEHGDDDASWDLKRRIWRQGQVVLGASDAGAHLDTLVHFNYATRMLATCRDRELIPLEEAVHLITDVQARFYGICGRGRIAEGFCADLMIFDPHTVGSGPVRWRQDLPAGAGRLYAQAKGIEHVLVNGVELVRNNQLTGATPGTVLRSGRDTAPPSLPIGPSIP